MVDRGRGIQPSRLVCEVDVLLVCEPSNNGFPDLLRQAPSLSYRTEETNCHEDSAILYASVHLRRQRSVEDHELGGCPTKGGRRRLRSLSRMKQNRLSQDMFCPFLVAF